MVQTADLTDAQRQAFARDGFVVVERYLSVDGVERLRDALARVFAQEYETGLQPDEVKWIRGRDPDDITRQVCNAWKADGAFAAEVLSPRTGRIAAELMGWDGVRVLQDVCLWKPPGAPALRMHRDGQRLGYVVPPQTVTCWLALDAIPAHGAPITYAAGSHRWPRRSGEAPNGSDWLEPALRAKPDDARLRLVPAVVGEGDAVFHRYDTFHGYAPQAEAVEYRAIITHFAPADARFHPTESNAVYSRYRRSDSTEMDESFFPIVWRAEKR